MCPVSSFKSTSLKQRHFSNCVNRYKSSKLVTAPEVRSSDCLIFTEDPQFQGMKKTLDTITLCLLLF